MAKKDNETLNLFNADQRLHLDLPPFIRMEKRRLYNGDNAHVFIHDTLKELGRIRYVELPNGNTNIHVEIAGNDLSDLITQQKRNIFEPIANRCIQHFDRVLKKGKPSTIESLEPQESRIIPSEIMPCYTCGHPAAMMIYSNGSTPQALEKDERAMSYKIKTLNLPTWIIGEEVEVCVNGKYDGQALSLKVWPEKESPESLLADDFYKKIELLQKQHCEKVYVKESPENYQRMGNDYLAWRMYFSGIMSEMIQQFPTDDVEQQAIVLLTSASDMNDTPFEKAVAKDYALFHFPANGTTWIKNAAKKMLPHATDGKQHIITAMKNAYFTGIEVLEILDESLGVMRVRDWVCRKERFFVDQAFCRSFLQSPSVMMISTVMDTGHFLFTTGAGMSIHPTKAEARYVISVLNEYIKLHAKGKPFSASIASRCAIEIVTLCLRDNILKGNTLHYFD